MAHSLQVKTNTEGAEQIFIRNKHGETITLDVKPYYTIQTIKGMLKDKEKNIDSDRISLALNGKTLLNGNTLKQYKIPNKSKLDIVESESPSSIPRNQTDPLSKLLKDHNLYDDLHKVLTLNTINLDMLENDMSSADVDRFCKEFGLTLKQKLKFGQLMRIIDDSKMQNIASYRAKMQRKEFGRTKTFGSDYNPDYKMTIVLIGDSCSGKTCLMEKYVNDTFSIDTTSTFGVPSDNVITVEELSDHKVMEITIFDTAGQERYQSLSRKYYRRGHCIILCYDLSEENPFENFEIWRESIEEYGRSDVVVIMVGCKKDLVMNEEMYQRNKQSAENMIQQQEWKKLGAMHCVCSAKTGDNIRNVFKTAAELALNVVDADNDAEGDKHSQKQEQMKKHRNLPKKNEQLLIYQPRNTEQSKCGALDHQRLLHTVESKKDGSKCFGGSVSVPFLGKLW